MLWMTLENQSATELYLDIHHVEHNRQRGLSISATLGDGCDEGEILIELGSQETVTFADMLPGSGLPQLLRRYGSQSVRQAVLRACSKGLPSYGARKDQPHEPTPQLPLFTAINEINAVHESEPQWKRAH